MKSKHFFRSLSNSTQLQIPNQNILEILNSIDKCNSKNSLQTLKQLHSQLASITISQNPSIAIKLMRAYSACGELFLARQLFDATSHKNIVFYNVMIRSYVNNKMYALALSLFSNLRCSNEVKPDNYTYPCALKACSGSANFITGVQIHGAVVKLGLDHNIFVGNTLIVMYSKCVGCLDFAYKVFSEMRNRDVVSWNSIIAGFAQSGEFDKATEICKTLFDCRYPKPDAGTMASILPAMSNAGIDNVNFIRKMFNEMSADRNLVSWNAMIAIYANNNLCAEAVRLYEIMEKEKIKPDSVTFASVLPSCGTISALSIGKRIHNTIRKNNMCPNLVLENALMDMYAGCGCLKEAREVFDDMNGRDVVSWTSIISAYGMYGYGHEAISLFNQMLESGQKPDHIAFISILASCSYSGLLDQGKYYFKRMTNEYKLIPRIEHYACMVDIIARSGSINEAYDFISKMPIAPNERVWGALLSACRVHSNMNIGLVAADHLFKLVPEQTGYYVLLSNIYAKGGRWDDVESVRSIMKRKGIKKLPGCSNVEINGKVHTFYIGDTTHPESKSIYWELDVLMSKVKDAGYVAEIESTLHDVEEEDKESHLSVHSEKLATAFAMISTKPGMSIRITMNLRICGDCHVAIKIISRVCDREIIIRDTNRFHHFKDGWCSCGDYW